MKANEAAGPIVNLCLSQVLTPHGSSLEFQSLASKGSGQMLDDTDKLIFLDYCAFVPYILTGQVHHRLLS